MASGNEPSAETPEQAARIKRIVSVVGGLNLGAELTLLSLNALLLRSTWRYLVTG
jgi:hypothetical protein